MASRGDARALAENAPLLPGGDAAERSNKAQTSQMWRVVAANPLLLLCAMMISTMAVGAVARLAYPRAASRGDKFFVGLSNQEGVGSMLLHIGCYADLARASHRRLVVVPQYYSEHYSDTSTASGEPAMNYSKYLVLDRLAPDFVPWELAPLVVRAAVVDNPDAILMANIMRTPAAAAVAAAKAKAASPDAAAAADVGHRKGQRQGQEARQQAQEVKRQGQLTVLSVFRYGPGVHDYPRLSLERWEAYQRSRPCGDSYCDKPSLDQQAVGTASKKTRTQSRSQTYTQSRYPTYTQSRSHKLNPNPNPECRRRRADIARPVE